MTSIDPINVNTQGVGARFGFNAKSKPEAEEKKTPESVPGVETAKVDADKVLDYLAAGAASVVPTGKKTVDPSKYVDAQSEARIAAFMSSFEDKVAEGLKAFDAEFAGLNISDGAKMAVVLKQVESEA